MAFRELFPAPGEADRPSTVTEFPPGWRARLHKASFRGAEFHVSEATTSVGRRVAVHEGPFWDTPYAEDLGRANDEFTIDGYVVQSAQTKWDYFDQRDTLIRALRESGPGTLIHPYLGEFTASLVGRAEISESFRDGGMARFRMRFVRTEEKEATDFVSKIAVPQDVKESVKSKWDKLNDIFSRRLDITGPSFLRNDVVDTLQKGMQTAKRAVAMVRDTSSDLRAAVTGAITTFQSEVSNLMSLPDELAANVQAVFTAFDDFFPQSPARTSRAGASTSPRGDIRSVVVALQEVSKFGGKKSGEAALVATEADALRTSVFLVVSASEDLDEIPLTTKTRGKQQENRNACLSLIRGGALIQAVRTAAQGQDYGSAMESISVMQGLAVAIETYLEDIDDDEEYALIYSLLPILVDSMQELGATLAPVVVQYKVPAVPTPVLMISYQWYRTLDREQEILDRNRGKIAHPGFPPGGMVLTMRSLDRTGIYQGDGYESVEVLGA